MDAGRPGRKLCQKHRWELRVAGSKVAAADVAKVVRFWIHLEGRAHSICQWIGQWGEGLGVLCRGKYLEQQLDR